MKDKFEELNEKFAELRKLAEEAGYELYGAILTPEESKLADTVMQSDDLYMALDDQLMLAGEHLGIDVEDYVPCVCFVYSPN